MMMMMMMMMMFLMMIMMMIFREGKEDNYDADDDRVRGVVLVMKVIS